MTVYEMIQELSRYKADAEVRFHVEASFDVHTETSFVTFSDYVDFNEMFRSYYNDDSEITIDLKG